MGQMPVFIKIKESGNIGELINYLKNKVEETKTTLESLKLLSYKESSKIGEWKSNLRYVNEKIDGISNSLLEPESI
ncbi:MAG: hypothetical protein KAK00_02815 [Nanoarchaeota archaeon]|nr:hypothetical protein [Nanoarchaeota archaeon]